MAGVVYVYFVKEVYPESLTGYAVDKHMNELLKIDQLRSTLQVKFRLGVTSKLSHDVYSQHMADFEVKYLGGFDSINQAKILINSLNKEREVENNDIPKKEERKPNKYPWGTEPVKEELPSEDDILKDVADPSVEDLVSIPSLRTPRSKSEE